MSKPSTGVIGVGNMDWPMAARLVEAGFSVQASDSKPNQAAKFA
jgi:3-hydroxyisobutyrate dehydrogenase